MRYFLLRSIGELRKGGWRLRGRGDRLWDISKGDAEKIGMIFSTYSFDAIEEAMLYRKNCSPWSFVYEVVDEDEIKLLIMEMELCGT